MKFIHQRFIDNFISRVTSGTVILRDRFGSANTKGSMSVKTILAGAIIAATVALSVPTPASAIGVFVGPRGGVGVRVGGFGYRGGYRGFRGGYGWRRPLVRGGYYRRGVWRRY